VPTLHILPGESPGDTAELIVAPQAVKRLAELLREAEYDGYASHRFRQRDSVPYSLNVRLLDAPLGDPAWKEIPLAYLLHGVRRQHEEGVRRGLDLTRIGSSLYAARKLKRHDQKTAAAALGMSVGFVSAVENLAAVPKHSSLKRIAEYADMDVANFLAPGL
jgi:hypothetical protein